MASWVSRIVGDGIGAVLDSAGKLADTFIQTPDERDKFHLALVQVDQLARTQLVQATQDALKSRERVLLAELKQDDLFTRRARPMVVYAGLGCICWTCFYCVGLRDLPRCGGLYRNYFSGNSSAD